MWRPPFCGHADKKVTTGAIKAGILLHPSTLSSGPSPPLSDTQGSSFPSSLPPSLPLSPPRPTSEQRTASRVFLPYKFSSRGANRSTPISAIISDSNYLQIYRQEEKYFSRPGPKKQLWFHLSPIRARNFYALKREKFGDAPRCSLVRLYLRGVTKFARCAPLLRFGRLEDRTALSPDRPYLVR